MRIHRETFRCGGPLLAVILTVAGTIWLDVGAGVQDAPDIIPPPKVTHTFLDSTPDPGVELWAGAILDDGAPFPPPQTMDQCNGGVGTQTPCCTACMDSPGKAGWLVSADDCKTEKQPDGSTKVLSVHCVWRRTGPKTFPWK